MGPDVVRRADPWAVGAILATIPEWLRPLEVHTVGPSHEDAGCARTRELSLAQGFVAMTELQRIDWNGPTLILVRPL
jgi:hypothetical protein